MHEGDEKGKGMKKLLALLLLSGCAHKVTVEPASWHYADGYLWRVTDDGWQVLAADGHTPNLQEAAEAVGCKPCIVEGEFRIWKLQKAK